MFKLGLTAIGCLLGLNALAQFTISGTVRDSKTNEVLIGATIQLDGQSRGAISDEQGHYELKKVASGKQTLLVHFLGYTEEKKEIEVFADMLLDFALGERSQLTDEVTVLATRATENSPTAFSNISKPVIQKQNF